MISLHDKGVRGRVCLAVHSSVRPSGRPSFRHPIKHINIKHEDFAMACYRLRNLVTIIMTTTTTTIIVIIINIMLMLLLY